ncbi:putative disease resistance RPP13-like protein 1 isoform X2 [Vitis riparia]|uniref:putative disease resistance RPP13-like protein 1 isoform X2 n=1 Tax=Vitis riparia TaxID=96939 RepID=UPI00155A3D57|nr:putative disease resistance RPP13-like protein 1 isoform X2 [Vitis riparia]
MEVVGELLLSAAFQVLFDKLASSDFLSFARQEHIHSQLKKWETQLFNIREVLNDAEDKQIASSSVKLWLADLRILAYDMEDILDEFNTEMLRRKLAVQPQAAAASTSKVWSLIPSCCTSFTPSHVTFNVSMGSKIKDITSRLEDISTRKAQLGLEKVAGTTTTTWKRTPTTSLFNEPQVHGRDDDKNKIVDLLLSDESAVVPIVGMGGLGKTTLTRLAYNDDAVVKHFSPRAWVCVSVESDVEKITKAILSDISPQSSDFNNFNRLQVELSQSLAGKRFLLVLDDVWNMNYEDWNNLRSPFRGGAKGSKVIVTTRDRGVALIMQPSDNYHHSLEPLSDDDCWSIFVQHAFENRDIQEHPNLKSIGKKIVEKCRGLPLAAKVLGGILRSKQRDNEWEHILNSKIWTLPDTECGIIPALRLSYHHLPAQLKRCFVYCATFPQDYEFRETELVLLWMAEGLIQPLEGNKQMEDLGGEYFRELVSRSFFQQSGSGGSQFVMHDLISDLAQSVAGQLCFNLEDKLKHDKNHTILQDTRHVSYNRCYFGIFKNFEAFKEVEKLRTFIALPIDDVRGHLSSKVFSCLFPKLRYLRGLSLSGYHIKELPDSVGDLKHLRYLNFSMTSIERLPESISKLYNLQALILRECWDLTILPTDIGNLVNLRHLDITDTSSLKNMPPRISNLVNLQTLSKFIVEKNNSSSSIKELKKLSNIGGTLSILGLHNVADAQDAMDVDLKGKHNIKDLTMEWGNDFDDTRNEQNEMQVLELLQPHKNLEKLTISFYGGGIFPSWMRNPSFSQMVQLCLKGCRNCTLLPSLGQLSSLKNLRIEGMSGIKNIDVDFYGQNVESFQSLESLTFSDMPEWEEWRSRSFIDEERLFPRLRELRMTQCPKLIPPLPKVLSLHELNLIACNEVVLGRIGVDFNSLAALEIRDCKEVGWLRLEKLGGLKRLRVCGCDGLVSLEEPALPCSLEYLEIRGCENLEKLPNELQSLRSATELVIEKCPKLMNILEKGWPPMLRKLRVYDCEGIKALPGDWMMMRMDGDNTNSSCVLERVAITSCPSLLFFPKGELPTSLKQLIIEDCENVKSLPEGIMRNCNLEQLNIWGCSSLTSFPSGELPSTLKHLAIWNCGNLELLPDHMPNLTSLEDLYISGCPSLESFPERGLGFAPNLTNVDITDCENLKTPLSEWGLNRLLSLKVLTIAPGGYQNVVSFSHGHDDCHLRLPTSLTSLHIGNFQNLESMASMSLPTLISLEDLCISDCPKLQQFLPKEGLPATLGRLQIRGCPIIEKRCLKGRGEDWPHIAHIPAIYIGDN